jgi:tetratricopeptide (TPR) repeat protein
MAQTQPPASTAAPPSLPPNLNSTPTAPTQQTIQVPTTTNPLLNNLPLPQNLIPNPGVAPTSNLPKAATESKYAEYQSYCRSNIYDVENEFSKFLKSDVSLNAIKNLIDQRQFYEAEKLTLGSRLKLGELNFLQSMILINALKRNFREAFNLIDSSNETFKNDLEIKRLAAFVYELQGNYVEAKLLLQDLYKLTKNSELLEGICRMNAIDSQHHDAEITCENAKRKLPLNFLPAIWLGISYRERQMYDEAKIEFEKSLKIRKSEFALTCMAEIESLRKDKKKSLEYFLKVIEFNPQSSRGQTGLALLYFELREYDNALEHFKAMCKLGIKDKIQFRRAQKELTLQKNPLAEKYFKEIQKCP